MIHNTQEVPAGMMETPPAVMPENLNSFSPPDISDPNPKGTTQDDLDALIDGKKEQAATVSPTDYGEPSPPMEMPTDLNSFGPNIDSPFTEEELLRKKRNQGKRAMRNMPKRFLLNASSN